MPSAAEAAATIGTFLNAPNSRADFLGSFLVCADFPVEPTLPDFSGRRVFFSGMIYGTGPVIAEYWTAAMVAAGLWKADANPGPQAIGLAYAQALHQCNQSNGAGIQARSNVLIDFKASPPGQAHRSKLELQYQGPRRWQATTITAQLTEDDGRRRGFYDRLSASDYSVARASPAQLRRGADKERAGAGQAIEADGQFSPNHYLDLRGYAVRRACKFLLYDTVGDDVENKGHVHYALDGMNLTEVAGARHRPLDHVTSKVPVCTSELRELFRMWPYFKDDVSFYRTYTKVAPPWEAADTDVWAAYAGRRAERAWRDRRVDERTYRSVADAVTANQWVQAIQAYHAIPARNLQSKALPREL